MFHVCFFFLTGMYSANGLLVGFSLKNDFSWKWSCSFRVKFMLCSAHFLLRDIWLMIRTASPFIQLPTNAAHLYIITTMSVRTEWQMNSQKEAATFPIYGMLGKVREDVILGFELHNTMGNCKYCHIWSFRNEIMLNQAQVSGEGSHRINNCPVLQESPCKRHACKRCEIRETVGLMKCCYCVMRTAFYCF